MSGINGGGRPVAAIWQGEITNFPLPSRCFVEIACFTLDWIDSSIRRHQMPSLFPLSTDEFRVQH